VKLKINEVDYAPNDLDDQIPFCVELIRKMKGPDRDDYWLGKTDKPIRWAKGRSNIINYVILATRWAGATIHTGMGSTVLGIAYMVDETLLNDIELDLAKCVYVAIGVECEEVQ
jgi:hypothetical protein